MEAAENLKQYLPWRIIDGLPNRVWFGFLLSVLSGVILAFVYVFGGGPQLIGTEGYLVFDSMLFLTATLSFVTAIGGTYYYFTRDISTVIAVVLGAFWSLYSGFEDIMVYLFCIPKSTGECSTTNGFPGEWTWLNSTHIGDLAALLGFDSVTNLSISVVVLASLLVVLFLVKILAEYNARYYGVDL